MLKKKLIVVNFKMNLPTLTENKYWLDNFLRAKKDFSAKKTDLVLCPPVIFWDVFEERIKDEDWLKMGAQNCFWEDKGAYTGEIGPQMIRSRQGKFVIIGHSERKKYLGEKDEELGQKIELILKNGLKPIFCVGENWQEKKAGQAWKVLFSQLEKGLKNVKKNQLENVIFCYEPVWAISANQPTVLPTDNDVMTARLMIKKFIKEKYDQQTAEKIQVIYGGSVDEKNFEKICLASGMDGALLGKTGLLVYDLLKIVGKMEMV